MQITKTKENIEKRRSNGKKTQKTVKKILKMKKT